MQGDSKMDILSLTIAILTKKYEIWDIGPDCPKELESQEKNSKIIKSQFKYGQLKFSKSEKIGRPRKKDTINS